MSKKRFNKQVEKILNNKTVHIEIPGEIHRKLRAKLFLDELSMQQFLDSLQKNMLMTTLI